MALPPTAPELQGDGLVLRAHRMADVAAIVEQCQDPEMQRWTTIPVPYTEADARWFVDDTAQGWRDGTMAGFAIEVEHRFAGTVDLRLGDVAWAEVGYGLSPWARGRHVMRQALALTLDWAFDVGELDGVTWRAHVGNQASRTVAEACGFVVEGTVRGLCVQRGRRVDAWIGTRLATDPSST